MNITVGNAVASRYGISANTNTTPNGGTGNINITSGLTIDVASTNGWGIYGTANSGDVVVENSGTITASVGAIHAQSMTGNITISNTGSLIATGILTGGSSVVGGVLNAYLSSTTATTGTVRIYNDGYLEVTEVASGRANRAMFVRNVASEGNIEVFLGQHSEIVTADGTDGIHLAALNSNSTGDMIVTTRGGSIDIGSKDMGGNGGGYAMYLGHAGSGKRVIDIDGTSIHNWINGNLNAVSVNGSTTTAVNGSGSSVVLGSNDDGGDVYASIQNATIRSDAASAITTGATGGGHVYIGYDAEGAEVPITGDFFTTYAQSNTARGVINAQTVNNSTGTGGIDISVGKAEIIANEKGTGAGVAMGIAAIKTSGTSGGNIHIKTSADTTIKTWGDNLGNVTYGDLYGASGILARNAGTGNKIDIDNSATITTHGDGAKGIFAYSSASGGETKIRNVGDITTSGASAHGIYAHGTSTGSVDLDNAGDITTSGTSAHGIYAYGTYSSGRAVDLTNTGDITTSGSGAHGIYAYGASTSTGSVDLLNTGTVTVNESNAYGIYVTGVGSGTVVNEGTVSNTASGGTAIRIAANNMELVLAGGPASLEGDRAAQVVGNVVFAGSGNKLSLGANVQDIVGNLTFTSTSTFEVSAQSPDDYQTLVVSGVSTLAGATLVFDDTGVEAEALHNGDVFTLIDGTSISGIFGGYSEGATYTSQGGNDYTISYLDGNVTLTAIVNAVAVPEPATCAVLAGLAAMLMLAAARRSASGKR
ncbi:MAG: hypothetical protein LBK99_02205 [Opitutaceae bacterium]|nr:hypothetical protein [Opitutaceae bacterium]